MKYSKLVQERADKMFKSGLLTRSEYLGDRNLFLRLFGGDQHICWYQCVNERNDYWQCEECGKYDPKRKPIKI